MAFRETDPEAYITECTFPLDVSLDAQRCVYDPQVKYAHVIMHQTSIRPKEVHQLSIHPKKNYEA